MPNRRKILIVDDDPELRDALTEHLSLQSFAGRMQQAQAALTRGTR